MAYLPRERRFAALLNRFDWAAADGHRTGRKLLRRTRLMRRRSALRFERVLGARLLNIDLKARSRVLSLLAIQFEPKTPPGGTVTLVFAGGGFLVIAPRCGALAAWREDAGLRRGWLIAAARGGRPLAVGLGATALAATIVGAILLAQRLGPGVQDMGDPGSTESTAAIASTAAGTATTVPSAPARTVVATVIRRPRQPEIGPFDFIDAENGWMASPDGTVWRTRDGGATWAAVGAAGQRNADALSFVDDATGWLVGGGELLATSDGGLSWTTVATPGAPYWGEIVADVGWIDTPAGLFKTLDRGVSWSPVAPPCQDSPLTDRRIALVSATEAVALCAAGVKPLDLVWLVKTTNGGQAWVTTAAEDDRPDFDIPDAPHPFSAPYLPRDIAYSASGVGIVGGCGRVIVARAGVHDWGDALNLGGDCALGSFDHVDVTPDGHVFASGGAGGPALVAGDVRDRWDQVYPGAAPTSLVEFSGPDFGIGFGTPSHPTDVLLTFDGGLHWDANSAPGNRPDLVFLEPGGAGIAISQGGKIPALRTEDFGRTWRPASASVPFDRVVSMDWSSSVQAWAMTNDGGVWRTADAWRSAERVAQAPLESAAMSVEASTIWMRTFREGLFASTDAGQTWGRLLGGDVVSAALADAATGWAVLDRPARLLKTADGGNTWTRYDLGDIRPQHVQAAGDAVWVETLPECWYRSTDGGHTWEQLPPMGWAPRCS